LNDGSSTFWANENERRVFKQIVLGVKVMNTNVMVPVTTHVIFGTYHRTGISEVIDSAYSSREARELVDEYQMAYGSEWTVGYRRARKDEQ
jgi:hypothetical protein